MNATEARKIAEENVELQARMLRLLAEENREKISKPLRQLDAAAKKNATPEGAMARVFIDQAAQLADVDYEAVRVNLAQSAGVRVAVLDAERAKIRQRGVKVTDNKPGQPLTFEEIVPWPDAVDAHGLLSEIAKLVRRHVVLSNDAVIAVMLWIVVTYLVDAVDCAPMLGILSATKRCGKTTLLGLLTRLVLRPLPNASISGPMVFRVIEAGHPTLLIDEADSFLPDNEALRGIINSGHTRETAFTIRGVGDDFEPRKFSTWGFKALAAIGKLPGTITDRAIIVRMERKARGDTCEKLRATPKDVFVEFQRKLSRFAADYAEEIRGARPTIPLTLNDRESDCWEPLLAIADLAGKTWSERARLAAKRLKADDSDADDLAVELLQDAFNSFGDDEKLASETLIERLCSDPTRPWFTYNRGKPISARQVAAKLKSFGITSGSVRLETGTPKGYKRDDFVSPIARYPLPSATPPQVNDGAASSDFPIRHTPEFVADEKPSKPSNGAACGVVADKLGVLEL